MSSWLGQPEAVSAMDGFAGQAINIASRLAEAAGPGEILVGPETYRVEVYHGNAKSVVEF